MQELRTETRQHADGKPYQVVERWVVVHAKAETLFSARQGRYTYATKEEAQTACDNAAKNNPPDIAQRFFPQGLKPALWWCYAGHFDPIGPSRDQSTPVLIEERKERGTLGGTFFVWSIYPGPGHNPEPMGEHNTREEAEQHALSIFPRAKFQYQ